jgi:NADPH:quinone reductase-like Zn-dependent oxidoreductase
MHAIVITTPGGPDVLHWLEVPDPEPGRGELLIDVAASAFNRADLLQRQGFYPPPAGAPPYPGLECAGRVAAWAGSDRMACGDEVCAQLTRCEQLGAHRAISYRDDDFAEVVRDFTGGGRAGVILDIMGASHLARNVESLALGGRLVVMGLQGGAQGGTRPAYAATEAGERARNHAAVPAADPRGRHCGRGPRTRLAARRSRTGDAGHRPRPADG